MKLKSVSLSFLILFVFIQSLFPQTGIKRMNMNMELQDSRINLAPVNTTPAPSIFYKITLDPGYAGSDYIIGPEVLTTLNGFYDYKTNGEAVHYIMVTPSNPDTIHSIDMQSDTLDATGSTTRRTYYAISYDGGENWFDLGQVPFIRSGYPVLSLLNTGAAVIANHSTATGQLNTNLYYDLKPGAGAFNQVTGPNTPFGIWPQMTVLNNDNVLILSRGNANPPDGDTIFIQSWDGTSSTLSNRSSLFMNLPPFVATVGSNARFNIASNMNGFVVAVNSPVLKDDTLANSKITARTSSDNGATWGSIFTIFSPHTVNGGEDTVQVATGSDLVCNPTSNDWYFAYNTTEDGFFASTKYWLKKSNSPDAILIVDASMVDATMEFQSPMAFVSAIDNAKLGWSADGNVLYCIYSVVTPNVSSDGFNSRDVYYQFSTNDGNSWSEPIRITNTPTIDETYPSISLWNPGTSPSTYEAHITYMKDPGVGPSSFNGSSTTAPSSNNHQIYRKITLAATIGVNNISTTAEDFKLMQNFPNPFNPATSIRFSLASQSNVTLKVYNTSGQLVSTLLSNERLSAGVKEVSFDGNNLASGVYFYTLTAGNFVDTKKMMLIK